MKAKTSSAVEKKPSARSIELVFSSATVCPVTTSAPGGSARAMARWTAALLAPGAATTLMSSSWPGISARACAVGSVNAARVAPARLPTELPPEPNWTMPVMVNVRGVPMVSTRTRWPTVKPYFCAVPASMATSPGPRGGPPSIRCSADSCGYGSKLTARVGAPPVAMALPSGATNWANPWTWPSAMPTPGTWRTVASSDSGTGLRVAFPPLPSWATPRTWKSTLAKTVPNSALNVLCNVSVRTNVPEMNVTPKMIASAVSASRSLCASSPLSVTFRMCHPPLLIAERPHAFQHGVGGRRFELAHHRPVGQEHHPVGVGGTARVVRHHDDRLAEFADRLLQEGQDAVRGVRVEVAGGLVGEDQVGLVDQRPGAGDALLLAAGELGRAVREAVGDAQPADQVAEPLPVDLGPGQVGREGDVLRRGQRGDQVEGLEDEADLVAAQPGEPGVVEPADLLAADERLPRRRPVQAGHAVHERRLAGPRRAHHRGEPAPFDGHVDAGQGVHGGLPGPVRLVQVHGTRRRTVRPVLHSATHYGEIRHSASPRARRGGRRGGREGNPV